MSAIKKSKFNSSSELTVLIAYMALFILFSIIAPYFLTLKNLMNILLYSSVVGITATGMTMVLLTGGIDISVGAIIGLSGMVSGFIITKGGSVFMAVALSLLTGAACGAFNGAMITKLKVSPMITTLATMSIYRGIAMLSTNGLSQMVQNDSFKWIGRKYIMDIFPVCVLISLCLFILIGYVLKYTPFGRKVYSVGGSFEASRLAGINVERVQLTIFMVCGLVAGLSGVVTASQTGASIPSAGLGTEMDIIGAVVLGGTSLTGGKGSILGTFIGVLILSTLSNGLTLLNVMSFWQTIAKGIVLLLAVILDVARNGGYKR